MKKEVFTLPIKLTVKDKNKLLADEGKQLLNYGLILKIYPSEEQETLINKTFGCSRFIYNKYLSDRKDCFSNTKTTLSVNKYKVEVMNPLKQEKDFEFLKEVDKFALEAAIENVDDAYSRFFKHQIKFPRFKSKKYAKKSYTTKFTNDNIRIDLDKIVIKLPKLKEVLFALPKRNKTNNKTLNPKFLRNFEKELIKLQKQLPKKIEGSKNYLKAKERLNLIHSQVTNQRKSGCNKKHDRDINASLNIRGEGMRLLG